MLYWLKCKSPGLRRSCFFFIPNFLSLKVRQLAVFTTVTSRPDKNDEQKRDKIKILKMSQVIDFFKELLDKMNAVVRWNL